MTATDLAAVLIAIVALAVVAVLVVVTFQMRRAARSLTAAIDEVRHALDQRIGSLDARASDIEAELERAGGLLDTTEKVAARADTVSRMTYGAVAKPVIKTAAVVKGTSRAARSLRRGGAAAPDEQAG